MSQAFGGEFMGLEVQALEVIQPMEMMCSTMGMTVENPQQVSVVMKCSKNSAEVFLYEATIRPEGVRFELGGGKSSVAVRC